MSDEFTQMTEPLKQEGMTAERATLTAVEQQAGVVATYYVTLLKWNIKPKAALDLTHHWMDIASGVDCDEDEE